MLKQREEIYNYVSKEFINLDKEHADIYESVHGSLKSNIKIEIESKIFDQKIPNQWVLVSKLLVNIDAWKNCKKKSDFFQSKGNYYILDKDYKSSLEIFLEKNGSIQEISDNFYKITNSLTDQSRETLKDFVLKFLQFKDVDKIEASKILKEVNKIIKESKLDRKEMFKILEIDANKASAYNKRFDLYTSFEKERVQINGLSDNKIRAVSKIPRENQLEKIRRG